MDKRNPSLDALRALAIILVVNCHAVGGYGSLPDLQFIQLGGKGVDLFFVLSGWLLGHQLMVELRDTGTVDVRRFWLRRWLRTLPAYYAVLLFIYSWQLFKGTHDIRLDYLCFAQNYQSMPYFSVSWSLCVEEHFYLLVAPLALMLFQHRIGRVTLLPLLLLCPTVCRTLGWYRTLEETHVRWDQCAIGVLLAASQVFAPTVWNKLCRLAPLLAILGVVVAGTNVLARIVRSWNMNDFGPLTWALVFASFVLLANSSTYWSRELRIPGTRYLADRAYAVYLLHGEAFAILKRGPELPFPVYLVLLWVVSLLLAEILHRAIEMPFMRARELFGAARSRQAAAPVAHINQSALIHGTNQVADVPVTI